MGVTAYRLRWWVRSRARSLVVLVVLVGAVLGAAMALIAGASRTLTAPERYSDWRGDVYDVTIEQAAGPPRDGELLALPSVTDVAAATFVFGGLVSPDGVYDVLVFAGSHVPAGSRVVDGRGATRVGELVVTEAFLERNDLAIGDEVEVITLTQEQADTSGFDTPDPAGPTVKARIVGSLAGPGDLEGDFWVAVVPRAFLDIGDVGVSASVMSATLADGATIDDLRREVDDLPDGADFGLAPAEWVSSDVRAAVRAQGQGLAVVAAVVALAALVVTGQLVGRQVRREETETSVLAAFGYSRRDHLMEVGSRALAVAVPASVIAAIVAGGSSPAFPLGFVRTIEPHPGLRVDVLTIGVGAGVAVVVLVAWAAFTTAYGARAHVPSGRVSLVERLAPRLRAPQASTGLRFAFERRANPSVPRTSLVGIALVVAGVFAAVTFGANLLELVDTPDRYGVPFDVGLGTGAVDISDDIVAELTSSEDVTALTAYGVSSMTVGSTTIDVVGMQPIRGDLAPEMVAGRLPVGDDELVLGPDAADALDVAVGESIVVRAPSGERSFRLTGLALVPPVNGADILGNGALVTADGLAAIDPDAGTGFLGIDLARGHRAERIQRLAAATNSAVGPPDPPPSIVNLERVRAMPAYVAVAMVVLSVLSLGHLLIVAVRRRRTDHAVLRSLGATPSWVAGAVRWQATFIVAGIALVAAPIGVIVGLTAFRRVAASIGLAGTGVTVPLVVLAALFVPALVLANVAAAIPARRARRARPADLLRDA